MNKPVQTTEYYSRDCDICGETTKIQILDERTEKAHSRKRSFLMKFVDVVCKNCGFVFSRTVPSNSFLFEYYSDSFTYQSEYTDITPDYDENSRIDTIKNMFLTRIKSLNLVQIPESLFKHLNKTVLKPKESTQ